MAASPPGGNDRKGGGRGPFVTLLMAAIALAHLLDLDRHMGREAARLYGSYFSDLILPFGFYFVVSVMTRPRIPGGPVVHALLVFAACLAAEAGQYLGIPVLGETFDPLDILAYLGGVTGAAIVDRLFFGARPPRR